MSVPWTYQSVLLFFEVKGNDKSVSHATTDKVINVKST